MIDRKCPDLVICDHNCYSGCWRVKHDEPAPGVYVAERWPESTVEMMSGDGGR